MSFLSRLIQRNLSATSDAVSGPADLTNAGFDAGTTREGGDSDRTGANSLDKSISPTGIQRQVAPKIEDQPDEQIARAPLADKPAVDTKPRAPVSALPDNPTEQNQIPFQPGSAPGEVQRMEDLDPEEAISPKRVQRIADETIVEEEPEETAQRVNQGPGVANEAEEPLEDAVISRKADTAILRKAALQKTGPLSPTKGPSKSSGLGEAINSPGPSPAFPATIENASETFETDNSPVSIKDPLFAGQESATPEQAVWKATPVPDTAEIYPNTIYGPETGAGLATSNQGSREEPTVIIERIDIHVSDDRAARKEPQADPLSTPLDAYYLRSL